MDYRLFHALNTFVSHHHVVARVTNDVETVLVSLLAAATFALWLLARPGAGRKWKLASASALGSAALALLVNQAIARVWHRPRPYEAHRVYHQYAHSRDPSFPSDHASAAFGIAVAVLLFDTLVGALFLAAAALIAVGRVVIAAHYPADVLAGALVGAACAIAVVRLARPVVFLLVRLVERLTDPIVGLVWRAAGSSH